MGIIQSEELPRHQPLNKDFSPLASERSEKNRIKADPADPADRSIRRSEA